MPQPSRKDITACAIEMLHARVLEIEARERARITAVEKYFADLVSMDHTLAESQRTLGDQIAAIQDQIAAIKGHL